MKKKRWPLAAALVLSLLLTATAALAAGAGSQEDPLVTLSYLNGTFLNTLLQRVDQKLAERDGGGLQPGSASASGSAFSLITLSDGQVLTGDIGCEVLLRIGSAVCVSPSEPGLIDETAGQTLSGGASLAQNHLYMMTIDGRGVRASAAVTKLLVRGSYTLS